MKVYCTSVKSEHDPRGPEGPFQFQDRSVPVYLLKKWDGETMTEAAAGLSFPNGVNASADGRTLYVASTLGRELRVYSRDPESGALESLSDELGRRIEVRARPGLHQEQFEVCALGQGPPVEIALPWREERKPDKDDRDDRDDKDDHDRR